MTRKDRLARLREAINKMGDALYDAISIVIDDDDVIQSMDTDEVDPYLLSNDLWPSVMRGQDDADKAKLLAAEFDPVQGKRILDFGCYTGELVKAIHQNHPEYIAGYDVNVMSQQTYDMLVTNDWQNIIDAGPYDLIIINDVLDHTVDLQNPIPTQVDVLTACKKICRGKMFVKCHPWTAKDGGHMDHRDPRAWIHLYATSDERIARDLKPYFPTARVVKPISTYEKWFKESGLNVISRNVQYTKDISPATLPEAVLSRIIENTWGDIDREQAIRIMSIDSIAYVVEPSSSNGEQIGST